jgi:hypothetical protein
MPEPLSNPELMRSLSRLVRGLSALFWGLPLALLICFHTVRMESLRSFGVLPPMAATALLVAGIWYLGQFQRQEQVWRNALDLSLLLGLINLGLSPFLYFSSRMPANEFFGIMVLVLLFSGVLFLASLNNVLLRLGKMLPDEALRAETSQFTRMNLWLLFAALLLGLFYVLSLKLPALPRWVGFLGGLLDRFSFTLLVMLLLFPLAMTMALIWKTKEVILESVFHLPAPPPAA